MSLLAPVRVRVEAIVGGAVGRRMIGPDLERANVQLQLRLVDAPDVLRGADVAGIWRLAGWTFALMQEGTATGGVRLASLLVEGAPETIDAVLARLAGLAASGEPVELRP